MQTVIEIFYTICTLNNRLGAVKPLEKEESMRKQIEEFKSYIEEVAKANYDDYDAVEYLDGFNYSEYNDAVGKINEFEEENGFAKYELLFTDAEMLTVSVMYACIRTGAIKSEMTKKLDDNWKAFASYIDSMCCR